eukprot:gene10844-3464_t
MSIFHPFKSPHHALFGEEMMEETLKIINKTIYRQYELHKDDIENIEIEGKIGRIIDKRTEKRISLPVQNEVILNTTDTYFLSNVDDSTFKLLNHFLNQRYSAINQNVNYKGPKMKYEKKRECDLFYKNSKSYDKIRVAIDSDTQKPLKSIQKEKKINLDFHVPNLYHDFRITIAVEFQREFPKETDVAQRQREKDRISYYFDNYQIDISVVTESKLDNFGNPILTTGQKTNEIEIELNSKILKKLL